MSSAVTAPTSTGRRSVAPVTVYLAVTAGPGMDLGDIIRAVRELPEAEEMSVVTGSLDLLVRLRVRDHTHLRELLLTKIFQISGVQRTETFLSLADVEKGDFSMANAQADERAARRSARAGSGAAGTPGDSPRAGPRPIRDRPGERAAGCHAAALTTRGAPDSQRQTTKRCDGTRAAASSSRETAIWSSCRRGPAAVLPARRFPMTGLAVGRWIAIPAPICWPIRATFWPTPR